LCCGEGILPIKDVIIFVAWKGLYFVKLCGFFFGVESGFLANSAIVFVMVKLLSLTNFVDFFCCHECIMEIC
jgi:lipid-binding SYLF domain-containing protein